MIVLIFYLFTWIMMVFTDRQFANLRELLSIEKVRGVRRPQSFYDFK